MSNPVAQPRSLAAPGAIVWAVALAATAIVGSMAYACILPFAALAVIVAATMDLRTAAITMLGIWATNQLLGYGVLGYPHTIDSYAWGAAIGVASLAAMFAARFVLGAPSTLRAVRLVGALLAAFLTYEGLLFGFAQVAGGLETFSSEIVGQIAYNDSIWFVALLALRLVLAGTAPRWFGPAQAIRLA